MRTHKCAQIYNATGRAEFVHPIFRRQGLITKELPTYAC